MDILITTISFPIEQLKELVAFNISNNKLHTISNNIGQCLSVQNLLCNLPDILRQCHNLKRLSIRGNKLESIPEGIGMLPNLKTLYIDYKQREIVPVNINKEVLFLVNN